MRRREADEPLTEAVRARCVALEEVVERQSHGEAAWFVKGGRAFAMMADHHHDDRVAVWLAAGDGVQQELCGRDPARYFRPPYVGTRGWVGAFLDVEPDWGEIEDLIAEAWSVAAPPRLRRRR